MSGALRVGEVLHRRVDDDCALSPSLSGRGDERKRDETRREIRRYQQYIG